MDIQTCPDPVARARELAAEIAAAASEIERTRRIPEALLERLHDSRLFRMLLPRSAGGEEAEPAVYVAAVEELARHDASTGWIAFVSNSSALIAAYLEPAVVRAIFADPRSTVAWGPPNASQAHAVNGGYRLTGRWDFASGCRQANWMGAHCHVLEADGTLRLNRFGRPTVRTLLFPASQATLLDTWRTIGLR
ncbi:MAG TPA: acyl-CoA dehydrogenase family protein, partial [Bradyrhizobium sp.]